MFEERNGVRFQARGKARVGKLSEGAALLSNLSRNGCCLNFVNAVNIDDSLIYHIAIDPEPEAGIPGFTVAAEARWIRASPWACAVGFLFNPAPRQVQKYLDFLSAPDSQNSAAGSGPSGGV